MRLRARGGPRSKVDPLHISPDSGEVNIHITPEEYIQS